MESINPYAPTTSTSIAPLDQRIPKSRVTSMAVASRTIAGISLSGGIFGVGLVMVMIVVSGSYEPEMLLYVGIAFGVGIVIAGIASFVTVPILLALFHMSLENSDSDDPSGSPWTVRRVVFFALVAGGISGFAPLIIPARESPEALILALVPAVVGAIGAYTMNRPCLRTLKQEQLDQLAIESERPDPLAFESPSI